MSLKAYITYLNSLNSGMEALVRKAIIDNRGKILSMIKLRLYQKGVDGDGNSITPEYSEITITNKKGKQQISSHVTLRDTGEWYKSMYVIYEEGEIKVQSDLSKTEQLVEKYGKSILDLTNQEIELIIISIIEPVIINSVNRFKQVKIDF